MKPQIFVLMMLILIIGCNDDNFPSKYKHKETRKKSDITYQNINQLDSVTITIDSIYFGKEPYSRYLFIDVVIENSSSITIKDTRANLILIVYEDNTKEYQLEQDNEYSFLDYFKPGEKIKQQFSIYRTNWDQYPDFFVEQPIVKEI